jgi:hypothetical protein
MSQNYPDAFWPFLEKPRSAVLPVFGSQNNSLVLLGSSVLIQLGNEVVLLTAAHVTDFNKSYDLLIPGVRVLIDLSGHFADMRLPESGKRLDDRYDIAYYRLDHDVAQNIHADFTILGPEDADITDTAAKGDSYSMIGFPATKSDIGNGTASADLLVLSGEACDSTLYSKLHLSVKDHLIVRYRRKKGTHASTGNRTMAPSPHGMSGGGVFAWSKRLPDPTALAIPKLVAILTEYRPEHNVFVATRLHCYLACIAKNNPLLPIIRD